MEYEVNISLEDKIWIVSANIFKAHIDDQGGKCSSKFMTSLGSLYHLNLLELLSNYTKSTQLQMELAISVDVGNVFVKATYNLEGDGPLVLSHMNISLLSSIGTTVQHPNTVAICYMITDFGGSFTMISNYH